MDVPLHVVVMGGSRRAWRGVLAPQRGNRTVALTDRLSNTGYSEVTRMKPAGCRRGRMAR